MGQQQLILLVLATVIVGLAIVVGIRAFNENALKSNADAMMQDAVRIANDLQAWKQKPAPFGGQASVAPASVSNRADFTGATFTLLGYTPDTDPSCAAGSYGNLNGCFTLAPGAGSTLITGTNAQHINTIEVAVCGLSDSEVAGSIIVLGNNSTGAVSPPACTTIAAGP